MAKTVSSKNKIFTVEIGKLKVHPTAQRKIVPSKKRALIDTLDLDAIGTLHVVMIDGVAYIIDGQHRWAALMHHGMGEWLVRCELHTDVTTHAEASHRFLQLNDRSPVATFDKYLNELEAGHHVAVEATRIAEGFGFKPQRQAGRGAIAAVNSLKTAFKLDEGDSLRKALGTIDHAWGKSPDGVEGKLLEGLSRVYARYNGAIDEGALAKKLAKYPGGAAGLLGNAKGLHAIKRGPLGRSVCELIVTTYNVGRRKDALEDWA